MSKENIFFIFNLFWSICLTVQYYWHTSCRVCELVNDDPDSKDLPSLRLVISRTRRLCRHIMISRPPEETLGGCGSWQNDLLVCWYRCVMGGTIDNFLYSRPRDLFGGLLCFPTEERPKVQVWYLHRKFRPAVVGNPRINKEIIYLYFSIYK